MFLVLLTGSILLVDWCVSLWRIVTHCHVSSSQENATCEYPTFHGLFNKATAGYCDPVVWGLQPVSPSPHHRDQIWNDQTYRYCTADCTRHGVSSVLLNLYIWLLKTTYGYFKALIIPLTDCILSFYAGVLIASTSLLKNISLIQPLKYIRSVIFDKNFIIANDD